jgi:hypothetical protein
MDEAAGSVGGSVERAQRRPPAREALVTALFDGLSDEDRAWVIERIGHYRRLAAANQAAEGRL